MVNVMQQVGGALGLAVLVACTAPRAAAAAHPSPGCRRVVAQQHHVLSTACRPRSRWLPSFHVVTLVLFITVIRGRSRKVAGPTRSRGREFAEEQALIE